MGRSRSVDGRVPSLGLDHAQRCAGAVCAGLHVMLGRKENALYSARTELQRLRAQIDFGNRQAIQSELHRKDTTFELLEMESSTWEGDRFDSDDIEHSFLS